MDFEFPCGRVPGGEISLFTMEQNAILRFFLCCDFTKRRKSFPSTRIYFCRAKMLATFSWERSFAWKGRRNSVPCRKTLAIPRREPMLDHGVGFDFSMQFLTLEKQSRKPVCIPPWFWYRFSVSISTFAYSLYFELISIPRYACFFYFRFRFKTCDGILVKQIQTMHIDRGY